MSPFKRERLSKEVKSGIKDTAVYPSASHTPSGGGGVHTPAKVIWMKLLKHLLE